MLRFSIPTKGLHLEVDESLVEKIYEYVKMYYPKEFGGIFIGLYTLGGQTLKLIDIVVPKKFINSRFLFIRYNKSINEQIKKAFYVSNGKDIYVGEWHSHPNGIAQPSNKDINTMIKISKSKKVTIGNPVLSIISFDGFNFNYNFFLIIDSKCYKYERV